MPKLALFDLDNTLADYSHSWQKSLRERGFHPEAEVSDEIETEIRRTPGWWREFLPLDIGFSIVGLLKKYDFEPHILSKGPSNAPNGWSEKIEWVQHHLGHNVGITLSTRKDIVRGDVLVEDWVKYLDPWLDANPDKFGILIDTPWNQGYTRDQVIRVGSEILNPSGKALFESQLNVFL